LRKQLRIKTVWRENVNKKLSLFSSGP